MRLCVHAEPTPEDFYFFLGYNTIVPPYVRLGLFSRQLNNDPVIAQMRKPMLLSYGEQDAIVLLRIGQHLPGWPGTPPSLSTPVWGTLRSGKLRSGSIANCGSFAPPCRPSPSARRFVGPISPRGGSQQWGIGRRARRLAPQGRTNY